MAFRFIRRFGTGTGSIDGSVSHHGNLDGDAADLGIGGVVGLALVAVVEVYGNVNSVFNKKQCE